MKANQLKYVAVAGLLMLGLADNSFAVDVAEASGVMADLEALVVQAKATLAKAALEDYNAVAEADARSAAIDAAVEAGRDALSAMENAIANGDADAAKAAEDDLAAALGQARDALEGALPATVAATGSSQQSKETESDAGGGTGKPGDPPNIYDVPWKSQGIRAYYQSLFGSFHDASGFGQGKGFGDQDATPQ